MPTTRCHLCEIESTRITEDGRTLCQGCEDTTNLCVDCGLRFSDGEFSVTGEFFCRSCYCNCFRQCDDCGCEMELMTDESVPNPRGRGPSGFICVECRSETQQPCNNCGTQTNLDTLRRTPDSSLYCQSCFETTVSDCMECGRSCFSDELTEDESFLLEEDDEPHMVCENCLERGEWPDRGFYVDNPTYENIRSRRKYGVEFETASCDNHISIRGDTIFGCKPDGSVDGMEFVSPVLYGDEGLEHIKTLCEHARRLNWEVDSSCGFHLHLDLSSESDENCFKVAKAYGATYEFWSSFISNARKSNYYCAEHPYCDSSFEGQSRFSDWVRCASGGEKYNWVNWQSYCRIKTVEIRNHSATLNPTKVINWIKAHSRFIDKVVTLSSAQIARQLCGRSVYDQMEVISGWWSDSELTAFYKERAAQFRKPIRSERLVASV